jgi:hypothetical protein
VVGVLVHYLEPYGALGNIVRKKFSSLVRVTSPVQLLSSRRKCNLVDQHNISSCICLGVILRKTEVTQL